MSGASPIPAAFSWSTLPKGTQIRMSAVAVLKAAGTLAGSNVQDSPLDNINPNNLPQINIWCDETRDTMSAAGTLPCFTVGYTLRIQALVIAADKNDAVQGCDVLAEQIREALLSDPVFTGALPPVESFSDERTGGRNTDRYMVQAIMKMKTGWRERYAPAATSVLLPGGQPQPAQRAIIGELSTINDTVVVGPVTLGSYTITFTNAAAFAVTGPVDGTGTVGVPYFGGIGFTIAAGSTPWAAGDTLTLAVTGTASPLITAGAGNTGNGSLGAIVYSPDQFGTVTTLPQT